jgi:hypothetical protein
MTDTIWTQRRAGSATSHTRPGTSEGEHVTIYDPSLSPDWLQLPNEPSIPPQLRGRQVRVECSCWFPLAPNPKGWFPLAPNPKGNPDDPDSWWIVRRTRWHVLQGVGTIAVAEVPELGWCVVDVGPQRLQVLRDSAGLP